MEREPYLSAGDFQLVKTPTTAVPLLYVGSSEPDCKNCPLHKEYGAGVNTPLFVPGEIRPGRPLLVGEAPGEEEVRQGRPFAPRPPNKKQNAAGVLWGILEDCGYPRESVSITNVLKCRPPNNKFAEGGARAVKACLPAFQAELALSLPPVLIALGAKALSLLSQGGKLAEVRGNLIPSKFETPLFTTYHPAYYLHTHEERILDCIYEDLEKVFYSGGGSQKKEIAFDLDLTDELPSRVIADIENWKSNGSIRCLGFVSLDSDERIQISTTPVRDWDRVDVLGGSFIKYDFVELRRAGWIPEQWDGALWDTILLAQLDGFRDHYGLKSFAPEFGYPIYWEEVRREWNAKPPRDPEDEVLLSYNAADVALTKDVVLEYRGRLLRDPGKARYFDRHLVPGLRLCAEVELNGAAISSGVERALPQVRARIKYRERVVRQKLELGREVNLNSSLLKTSLYEKLDLPVLRRTKKTKKPQFTKEALEELLPYDSSGIVKKYLELSALRYQETEIKTLIPHAGKLIHPRFNLGGRGVKDQTKEDRASPVTGRLSSEKPNFQNFPPWLRRYVVSRYPSGYLLKADARQIEIKSAYCYSGDPNFLKDDLHSFTADLMSRIMQRKYPRQDGKTCNFAIIYGAEVTKLMREFQLTKEAAVELRTGLREEFHVHFEWLEELKREARETGRVSSLTGRDWVLPKAMAGDPHALNQACNYPIQNLASDLNLLAATKFGWRITDLAGSTVGLLWNLVHDEADYDLVSKERALLLADSLRRYWIRDLPRDVHHCFGFDLPIDFTVETLIGENWLELEEIS